MFKPGTVMYARAAKDIVRHSCEFCGADLSAHQAMSSGICDKPQCHERMIEKVGTELIERKKRENAEALDKMFTKMAPVVEIAAASIDASVDDVIRSKIPYQPNAAGPVPQDRRDALEKHLRWIADRSFTEEVGDLDLGYRSNLEIDMPDVLETACSACRGGCCSVGGDTGFLHDVDVDRWRARDPETTKESFVDYYLGMVPEEVIEEGCIFQSETGCVLPRDKRNDQCHTFYCKSMQSLQDELVKSETGKVVLIADNNGDAASVIAWSPQTGRLPVTAAPKPAEPSAPQPIVFSSDDFE